MANASASPLPLWRAPRQWLSAGLTRLLAARTPRTDHLVLTQRNVYILPTRPGWMLGVTLLVMLVGSINYQLNLGYLLTFLLAGAAVVGVHVGHGTLCGLALKLAPPAPCFAGASARLAVELISTRRSPRHGIGLAVAPAHHTAALEWAHVDVPAQGSTHLTLGWQPPRRGRHPLPNLAAETRFPLGTFRVWSVWRPAATVLVYPQPETHPPPLPPASPKAGTAAAAHTSARQGEWDGVRAYRRGDPLKAVVWKRAAQAMARGSADLVSRAQADHSPHELWLDWRATGTADAELRAARLTAWVLQADQLGLDYGLRLPHTTLPPAQGSPHRLHSLEALALC